MPFKIVVRKANNADLEAMVTLLMDLFSIEEDFSYNKDKQKSGLCMMLEVENSRCIMVAEVDAQVIGMCTAQILISTAEGGPVALIEDLVINELYRKQGIGKELLSSVENWALGKGAKRLALLADSNNSEALLFYDKINWRKTQLICLHKK